MGHLPPSKMRQLASAVVGADFDLSAHDAKYFNADCPICPLASMKASPHKRHAGPPPAKKFGDQIHMDLVGPLPKSYIEGHRYGSLFIDYATNYMVGYGIRTKRDHLVAHKQFTADTAAFFEIKN